MLSIAGAPRVDLRGVVALLLLAAVAMTACSGGSGERDPVLPPAGLPDGAAGAGLDAQASGDARGDTTLTPDAGAPDGAPAPDAARGADATAPRDAGNATDAAAPRDATATDAGNSTDAAGARDAGPLPPPGTKPTVYLASDSTVQTYSAAQAPQQGWGQRIAEFFTTDVVFVNRAIGGRSSKSFIDEGRLADILRVIKPGDYLFCQWGINDRYTSDPVRYTNPATTFRDYLRMYIDGARARNAIPILITPTPRLDYVNGKFQNDFQAYCDAIQAVGAETNTKVIDLQTKGLAYYTSIGYDAVVANISLDVLHFKTEGAFQMARLVAEGVKELDVGISPYVK